MFKYKGQALMSEEELNHYNIPHKDRWVSGYYVDGYILGDIVDSTDEYINLEWWARVNKKTVQEDK